jgi:meso-butanediol dehydrogenase / (S,S)-butanediol dehydrogenase / diacetyl reductase
MAGDLENKVVVITGGADGIGLECAMACERAGAKVAILDRNAEALERATLSGEALRIEADVAVGGQVERAIAQVLAKWGRIDGLHNNAGIAHPSKPLHITTEAEWDELFRVNLKTVYWTERFAHDALAASKGAIVNTASMVGMMAQDNHAAYCATKGGMIALTKALAIDYAPLGVRVNAVCPAGVLTPMMERWCAEQPNQATIRQSLNEIHLLGYCPKGDVVADAVVFLLSDKSRFITGCILPVSGGAELGYKR